MQLKNKNILVAGGAGFIGSHLVEKIVKDNQVLVVDNLCLGRKENLRDAFKTGNLRLEKKDIRDLKGMTQLMQDIDIVFHLAAKCVRKSLYDPFIVHDVNASGALNLYIAAYKNKIKRFIHISSSEVYGTAQYVPMDEKHPTNPETVYGASKLAGELYGIAYHRTFGFPVIVIRPFNTYGPRSYFQGPYGEVIPRFAVRIMNNLSPIIFGNGRQTRDFTYVDDTVEGIIKASKSDELVGQIVNIAYGKERSINEVAEIILEILGTKQLGVEYQKERPGDVKRHYANTNKAKNILKFKPKISLEVGILKYITWLKKQNIDFKKALRQVQDRNW